MSQQHSHHSSPFTKKNSPIHILCDRLSSPANMGSLFRIADAFGVEAITFGGSDVPIDSARLKRTARNTHQKIPFEVADTIAGKLASLREQGYLLIALEITETSQPLQEFISNDPQKIALIIGNEKAGVSPQILQAADRHLHIEMYGDNSSMNVVQATAIALYALTKH